MNLSTLIVLLSTPFASTSMDSILECQRQAAGERMSTQPPVTIEVGLEIAEPGFEVTATYRASRSGRMRIDIFAQGQRVFVESLDGEVSWQWRPGDGVSQTSKSGAAALRHGIELPGRFFTFADLEERGHAVFDLGEQVVDGKTVRVLKVVLDDGFEKEYWLDPQSCRVIGNRDFRAFHPDIDPTEVAVETRKSDFRTIQGLTWAWREEQHNGSTGEWMSTLKLTSVIVDADQSSVSFSLDDLRDVHATGQ